MNRIKSLNVLYHGEKVGKMALYKVFMPKMATFDGMFGVFADSLPDGWGRLLVDRLMLKNGMDPRQMGNMERLAIVGSSGMGALTYEPDSQSGL